MIGRDQSLPSDLSAPFSDSKPALHHVAFHPLPHADLFVRHVSHSGGDVLHGLVSSIKYTRWRTAQSDLPLCPIGCVPNETTRLPGLRPGFIEPIQEELGVDHFSFLQPPPRLCILAHPRTLFPASGVALE